MTRDRFTHLTTLAARHDTGEIEFDPYLWDSLYEFGTGDIPEPDQITEITHLWATSPEGYASTSIALLARLADGRWATCVAWSDTSGFGCQQQVDWRIHATRGQAVALGLDTEARGRLGLALGDGESTGGAS